MEQELSLVNSEGSQESKAMKISNIVNQFESYEEKELDSEFGWIYDEPWTMVEVDVLSMELERG